MKIISFAGPSATFQLKSMDFFDQQQRARRQSKLLKWYFAVAVLAKVIAYTLVFGTLVQLLLGLRSSVILSLADALNALALLIVNPPGFWKWFWHPEVLCVVAALSALSVILGSAWKIRALSRRGGSSVAELLGGRRLASRPGNPDELKLRQVVEEMAIAAGLPAPEIYLLDAEPGINAFAAGFTPNDIVIGVTRGAVQLLDRDELQGMVAHEFSHILNGDTRLNMEIMGLVHGLLWPAIVGRVMVHGDCAETLMDDRSIIDEDTLKRLPAILLGYPMIWLGLLGLPFVRAVKSALCRKREFLADAAAVQFTRYDGIASALKKVGGLYRHGRLDTPYAEVASHLYFVTCHMELFITLLATHPPLEQRIRAIDPGFDGKFTRVSPLRPNARGLLYEPEQISAPVAVAPEQLITGIGNITPEGFWVAASLREALPKSVQSAVNSKLGAMGVLYALLLSSEDDVRTAQLNLLKANGDPAAYTATLDLMDDVQNLDVAFRLPLMDLTVPTLRGLDLETQQEFMQCVQDLIEADSAIELFEYTLQKALLRRLHLEREVAPKVRIEFETEKPVLTECAVLLSALAQMTRETPGQPEAAFARGVHALMSHAQDLKLLPRDQCNLAQVDAALETLAKVAPTVKRRILLACGLTVTTDGKVERREIELLRAIANSLDCPIPPFVEAMEVSPQS
ncbi:MAG: M48 family metalloprotease [Verrucomicrobia bacterium]|nr:M48 family metalloprotease [Verrucomicrobiota bacterium]